MQIRRITTEHRKVPLPARGRISLQEGGLDSGPTAIDLLVARVEAGDHVGFGYTVAPGWAIASLQSLVEGPLANALTGEDPRDSERLFARITNTFRSVGFGGLAARASCAVDIACWDLKAKAAGVPLFKLLGNARASAPFFCSDIALPGRDVSEVLKLAKPLLKQGATGLRVVVGSGDVQADADRVRAISEGLGDDGWVSVAANERFDLATAQALSQFFEDIGADLFEDPISALDDIGHARLAELQALPLAVGSGYDSVEAFYRVIRAGQVRTVRPDPCRLGGLTPVLKVAAVAEAFHVAVSPVRMPELGVHLACGLGVVSSVDHVGWFKDVFTGGPKIEHGKIHPPAVPGLGIELGPA